MTRNTIVAIFGSYAAMGMSILAHLPEAVTVLTGIAGTVMTLASAYLKWAQARKTIAEAEALKNRNDEKERQNS